MHNPGSSKVTLVLALLCACLLSSSLMGRAPVGHDRPVPTTTDIDFNTWVDANSILMFVTNKGSIAFDNGAYFGKSDGLYYPFSSTDDIMSGLNDRSCIYAGGFWVGAVDSISGDTLVTSSSYTTDWGVGPIAGDSSVLDAAVDPSYRVYKLYRDSLGTNPNQDYLDWPTGDGAPVDRVGDPMPMGDQTLWAVYNDLDADAHVRPPGSVGRGLGIEVHQTVWASEGTTADTTYDYTELRINHIGSSDASVTAQIVDTSALNHHTYWVVIDTVASGQVWHLIDMTTLDTVLADQITVANDNPTVTDGFRVQVYCPTGGLASFQVVANASGVLDPPEPGAAAWAGFPVPDSADPGDRQQVGAGKWLFHAADNGGTCGGGTRDGYDDFLSRATRYGANLPVMGICDYEMRFTGSNDNPGVGGGYAIEAFFDDNVFWVPFELWNIGVGTPDYSGDDYRLVPFTIDDGGDDIYSLESWGCIDSAGSGGDGEHSVSDEDNDPFTDWVYWYNPTDVTPGQAGYLANEADMLDTTFDYSLIGDELLARTVLVNWDGGEEPPFNQNLPEQGTVFRITTMKEVFSDTFSFVADIPKIIVSSDDESSVYVRWKLINKGGKTLENLCAGIWFDPDLGDANDDYVGCDTLSDVFFCYNAHATDYYYGTRPPAVGAKILEGPIVPSPGEVAYVDGQPVSDHRNLGMSSFARLVSPFDPDSPTESYRVMNGLQIDGSPQANGTLYSCPGDPVTGTGDLDVNPDDRRMMANLGSFTFRPGDTQQVVIRLSAATGADYLSSVTDLKNVLNQSYSIPTDVDDPPANGELPTAYSLSQNYPNPFNPSTTIEYSLPTKSYVTISIYNILGQEVKTLVNTSMSVGDHVTHWNGTDQAGERVASGIYFYRIKADDFVSSKKMLLLK